MSRSTNIYPSYVKLDLDQRKPPEGWRDGVRRCIICDRNWPNLPIFVPTPCCNAVGGIVLDANPDMTWPEAVSALFHFRFERYYDKWNEGITDEQMKWIDIDLPVSDEEMSEGMQEIDAFLNQLEEKDVNVNR